MVSGKLQWASYQIRKIAGAHAPGMPGTFSPSLQVSDPDMHHGTCVTHVPGCMPGSLTSSFLWNRRRGKRSRHSRRMRNLQFYVSGKRSIIRCILVCAADILVRIFAIWIVVLSRNIKLRWCQWTVQPFNTCITNVSQYSSVRCVYILDVAGIMDMKIIKSSVFHYVVIAKIESA